MRRWPAPLILAVIYAHTADVTSSFAQMILPGAEPPAPAGTTTRPSAAPQRPRAPRPAFVPGNSGNGTATTPTSPGTGTGTSTGTGNIASTAAAPPVPLPNVVVNVPSVASVLGKTLHLNGSTSEIILEAKGGAVTQVSGESAAPRAAGNGTADREPAVQLPLVVTRLNLVGDLLSKPNESCRIEIKPVPVLDTESVGRPAGAMRYRVAIASCPFTFDVLDGAILPTKDTQSCAFKSADCQVNVGGLWGPKKSDIGPEEIKNLERARAQADLTARETFHDLLKRTKGKDEVKKIASEQAAFSSLREETCRTYDGETVHHFCSTRLTQARVAALQTGLDAAPPPDPKKERKKKRRE